MPASIIPCLRYRDAPAAIEFLKRAFGFAEHAVHRDEQGGIAHAELVLGQAMIMLGTAREDTFGALQGVPEGKVTQSAYIVVPDPDAHHDRAVAAGAEVVLPLKTEAYGRGYSCRDPEGHLWHFGSYNPWAAP
ncbi:VOC family protein [Siccirubricoccus sp. KC 17139]|uniref:VOC family protein n=1 Tax=Siccirubricoccus soli TaxID=2899147 RepID=A0ABT1D2U0_9PROT|nr:VOC family protein [Siccirubricoccus soli]MCO6415585.1 VOC family protein [Siccirubricoccus soli]MCP2681717.1 VOC family protein [Siccirubricoccus soli]